MKTRNLVATVSLCVATLTAVDACSSDDEVGVDCANSTATYAEVSPIFQSGCATNSSCHGSGSTKGPGPLTTYAQIFSVRSRIKSAVSSGRMPQGTFLSSDKKNSIVCWIENGAPEN